MSTSPDAPHEPDGSHDWAEFWDLSFESTDGSVGGFVRLTLRPGAGVSSFWTVLRTPEHSHVAVIEEHLPPARASLEFRASGIWVELVCEDPMVHYAVGLEAFGLQLDAPGDEVGYRVPVGYDLEWESEPAETYPLACRVHGEILVADEVVELDGFGLRDHRWGPELSPLLDTGGALDPDAPHAAISVRDWWYRRSLDARGAESYLPR